MARIEPSLRVAALADDNAHRGANGDGAVAPVEETA